MVVQSHPLVQTNLGLLAIDLLVNLFHFQGKLIGHLVAGVIFQYIEDEVLFNRLSHAVHMKGFGLIGL